MTKSLVEYFELRATGNKLAQSLQVHYIYNAYRLMLALILLIGYYFGSNTSPLGMHNGHVFFTFTLSYACFNTLTLLIPRDLLLKSPHTYVYLAAVNLTDILIITILSYASGGVSSGLAPLLLMPVASASLLFNIKLSNFFAAVATIALFYCEFFLLLTGATNENNAVQTGLIGTMLFITAWGTQWIVGRIQEKDRLTQEQAASIEALQKMNQQIISRMQTGIAVVNQHEQILNINGAARVLLGLAEESVGNVELPPRLRTQLREWQLNAQSKPATFRLSQSGVEIQANFAPLQNDNSHNVLIFLEDNSNLSTRAQHLKLMSLGRLTASIAHEIRNPLGAISHASQLLRESPELQASEARLLDIIHTHTKRVNTIIQNVLELSRHKSVDIDKFELIDWLHKFISKLTTAYNDPIDCTLFPLPGPIWIQFNPSQLDQVLTNLCDNGIRYSLRSTQQATVTLQLGTDANTNTTWLDVIDDGPGIPDAQIEHLFEPFFTTEASGTGLGLFICKELCEANQTRLYFQRTSDGRSAFRLHFAHPDRHIHSPNT
jgi:two-component system, NtrC family, sensor histidine kinase PilS